MLPYIAPVPARAQLWQVNWKGAVLVGAALALVVATAIAATAAR